MRSRGRPGVLYLSTLLALVYGRSVAQPPDLASLFPHQAEIEAPSGLARLELPAEVLAECRADLSDLRLFDSRGNEVAYVVDNGIEDGVDLELRQSVGLVLLEADRQTVTRGRAPRLLGERYLLGVPLDLLEAGDWDLVFDIERADFVTKVDLTALFDRGRDRPLVEGGSIFRMAGSGREKVRLPLPPLTASRLRLSLETEGGSFLEPRMMLERRSRIEAREPLLVTLRQGSRRDFGGSTTIELERPRGLVPERLRFGTATQAFERRVEVWDQGSGARDEVMGEGEIFRLQSAATVEGLELALAPALGEVLRVVIENLDSPPLEELSFEAVLGSPVLVFALPAEESGRSRGLLRFGGARAHRPRYDLAHLRPGLPAQGAEAVLGEVLYDPMRLPSASLGEVVSNPSYKVEAALGWAMRPGAELDPRLYSHRRELVARPSREGLSRLRLGLKDLAASQPNLADLRLLGPSDQQWAFLLERGSSRLDLPLGLSASSVEEGTTHYELVPPAVPAKLDEIVIDSTTEFFDRSFELLALLEGDAEATLARGRLVRQAGDPRAVRVAFEPQRVVSLSLRIVNGDDAPLQGLAVGGRFPVPDLYFVAPEGRYSLLLGNPEDAAPRYELARVSEVVLAVASGEAEAGPLEENERFSKRLRLASGAFWQQALLWLAIGVVVIVLVVLTLRLVRQGPSQDSGE